MNPESPFEHYSRLLWIVVAATAGAVTGALVDKTLTLQGKLTAFFIGLTGSIFVGPLLVEHFFPGATLTPQAAGFYYLLATVTNSALPSFINWASSKAKDPLAFLRQRGGSQ
jgi:uncharacterized membrane protein YeaQ/YmgE (transglycosylase-associated protein family)